MRVYLETLGCRLNFAEMATLGRQLSDAGHALAPAAAEADLCVLNSCAVTGEAARQSRQLARQLHRTNPNAKIIVTGCYATLEGESVAQLPNVMLVVGNTRKDELLDLVGDLAAGNRDETGDITSAPLARSSSLVGLESRGVPPRSVRTRAFVKVQDGCRNRCTFCIVTVARGDERSRRIADIVTEVRGLHAEGYQEAVLTGVHLGGYGREGGGGLSELLRALLEHTDIPRLRLSSLEPFDIEPDFFELWQGAAGRLMPHLHLPAQSGSDAVLKRMARRNRVQDFEDLVDAARTGVAGLTVTTDVIVGFPAETDADFAESIRFARRIGFAHMHIFSYSARQGTAAARFAGQIPEAERKGRARELAQVGIELSFSVRRAFVGDTRPVLWENEISSRERARMTDRPQFADESVSVWSGLTDNYLRVLAAAPIGVNLHNTITSTQLSGLVGGDLWGELI